MYRIQYAGNDETNWSFYGEVYKTLAKARRGWFDFMSSRYAYECRSVRIVKCCKIKDNWLIREVITYQELKDN